MAGRPGLACGRVGRRPGTSTDLQEHLDGCSECRRDAVDVQTAAAALMSARTRPGRPYRTPDRLLGHAFRAGPDELDPGRGSTPPRLSGPLRVSRGPGDRTPKGGGQAPEDGGCGGCRGRAPGHRRRPGDTRDPGRPAHLPPGQGRGPHRTRGGPGHGVAHLPTLGHRGHLEGVGPGPGPGADRVDADRIGPLVGGGQLSNRAPGRAPCWSSSPAPSPQIRSPTYGSATRPAIPSSTGTWAESARPGPTRVVGLGERPGAIDTRGHRDYSDKSW